MRFDLNNLAFIPTTEMQNIFSTWVSEIEQDYRRQGIPRDVRTIFEHIDDLRMRLIKRSQFNLKEFIKQNPEVKMQAHVDKKAEESSQTTSKSWKDRVEEGKKAAIREALEQR